jgi:hypothetical protein
MTERSTPLCITEEQSKLCFDFSERIEGKPAMVIYFISGVNSILGQAPKSRMGVVAAIRGQFAPGTDGASGGTNAKYR